MMTSILLTIFGVGWIFFILQEKFKIIQNIETNKTDQYGDKIFETKVNIKPIVVLILGVLAIFFQPYGIGKVEAGYKGLLVNLIGDSRGASSVKEASGFIIYNSYTEELYEIPLDQRNITYPKSTIVAKGGFACDIHPTFNYSVKEQAAPDMFTNLRSTFKSGGLEAIEQGWLQTAILGAVNDVSNKYVIDDIFNNRQAFEASILIEANKRVGKWFTISQLKTNIQPPDAIKTSINAKAKAVQDAITSESQAKAATADAQRKIAIAKGDSATVVIRASAQAAALELKQRKLSPLYIEYMKAEKWDGKMPSTVLGNGNGTLINLK